MQQDCFKQELFYGIIERVVIIMIYKEWKFENGIRVEEVDCNYDLHNFEVYSGDRYLGDVCPNSIEDMNECIAQLNGGSDPVTDGWEDGFGNQCTLNGWGELRKKD